MVVDTFKEGFLNSSMIHIRMDEQNFPEFIGGKKLRIRFKYFRTDIYPRFH